MERILSFDTPSSVASWMTVDDVVMGGRSGSQVGWVPGESRSGFLRFEGQVSLENNGGFCSVRNRGQWELPGARELIWTLRGSGRAFMATVRDGNTPEGASFRHPLTPTGEWRDHRVRLEDFRLFRRGRQLSEQARIDPGRIHSFGFLLADKQSGPFQLDLEELRYQR